MFPEPSEVPTLADGVCGAYSWQVLSEEVSIYLVISIRKRDLTGNFVCMIEIPLLFQFSVNNTIQYKFIPAPKQTNGDFFSGAAAAMLHIKEHFKIQTIIQLYQ